MVSSTVLIISPHLCVAGTPSQPIPLIKAVIQAAFDIPKLRNEVYCQVIKLTTAPPAAGATCGHVILDDA